MISKYFVRSSNLLLRNAYYTQYPMRQFGILDKIFKRNQPVQPVKEQVKEKTPSQIQREEEIENDIKIEVASQKEQQQQEQEKIQQQVNERDNIIFNLDQMPAQLPRKKAKLSVAEHEQPQQEQIVAEVVKEGSDKLIKKVQSLQDKLRDITKQEDGSIVHNLYKSKDGQPRKFKDEPTFQKWMNKHLKERREDLKLKLTPQQFYVTQGAGNERPFTGAHWWTKDVGIYSCVCCTQRLFVSDHKYDNPSGFPTFWNHIVDAVEFKDDHLQLPKVTNAHVDTLLKNRTPIKRCICSNCEAHLGHVFNDGPAPFGKRFQINSAALNFLQKPWFTKPTTIFTERLERRKHEIRQKKELEDIQALLKQEKLLGIVSYKDKQHQAQKKVEKVPVFDLKGSAAQIQYQQPGQTKTMQESA